ncbi:hypothetical protein HDR58_09945 [bacterium]|nr:hypothetical protein [bacterium]
MSDKRIHVNSYTREDGTNVREHYRGINSDTTSASEDSNSSAQENSDSLQKLEGRISVNDQAILPEDTKNSLSIIDKTRECINKVLKKIGLKNTNSNELIESLNNIKEGLQESIIREQLTLDYLTKVTDSKEYEKIYKIYSTLRQLNQKNKEIMARIEYLNNQNNIAGVVDELENLKTNFDEIVKQNKEINPLIKNNQANTKRNIPEYSSFISKNIKKIVDNTKDYEIPRKIVDLGMFCHNIDNTIPDAAALWEAASNDFSTSKEYITQNGSLVGKISDLPSKELQNIVQKKVKHQLDKTDTIGIILNSESNLAQEISISPELKNYYIKNKDNLQKGKVIKGGSTYLGSSENIAKSIGHTDIVYSYIDKQGNLISVLLDTYDFNKDDKDWKVQIARQAQDLETIRTYYEIIITKTPKSILETW